MTEAVCLALSTAGVIALCRIRKFCTARIIIFDASRSVPIGKADECGSHRPHARFDDCDAVQIFSSPFSMIALPSSITVLPGR